jgi:ubiquinone/menaquinone biosynthesis C-methylase UbiE
MANYYNKSASAPKSKPDEIIQSLALKPEMQIADLGAGGGYFTLRFARFVGERGKVYAVDINEDYLKIIGEEARQSGLKNIQTILAKVDNSLLPEGSVDLIFVRNVFHHLPVPEKYFRDLKTKLKPGGRIAIVEYKKLGFFSFTRIFRHHTPEEQVIETMKNSGYHLAQRHDFLKKQSFSIYSLAEKDN